MDSAGAVNEGEAGTSRRNQRVAVAAVVSAGAKVSEQFGEGESRRQEIDYQL